MMMAMAAIFAGCSNEEEFESQAGYYTLTGYADAESRTAFGTPGDGSIPFKWSAGDKIWVGSTQSDAIANGGNRATFTFASEPSGDVYYNMTSASATEAHVKTKQSVGNLGENGDFGYGTISNGSFKLNHATAYLWFDVTSSISNAQLETINIHADGGLIAGKATWDGSSFGSVSDGKSFVELTVDKQLASANNNVWAMVVLPADLSGKTVKVTYKLTVENATKYYTQTLAGKKLTAGTTQKITADIKSDDLTDYELRVLTFEDADAKFTPYSLDYVGVDITTWSERQRLSGTYNPKNPYKIADYFNIDAEYGTKKDVKELVNEIHKYGMKVHLWMQICYSGGKWVRPMNKDGTLKYGFLNKKIAEAKRYAKIKGIDGIHFDYIRFGGTAHLYKNPEKAINYFVKKASVGIHKIKPNCIVSAAVMPEPSMMHYYYGQDIAKMGRYLDVIVPMTYKGNYHQKTSWITSVVSTFKEQSKSAVIWAGLQTYQSDDNVKKLTHAQLLKDAKAAKEGGATGSILFRIGITHYLNFKKV